jgi:hypothetical protein
MKRSELEEIIEEEIYKALAERTIASRNPPRKMSRLQVNRRDSIGKKMEKNKKAVAGLKKRYGDDWKSYLWAISTNKAIDSGE